MEHVVEDKLIVIPDRAGLDMVDPAFEERHLPALGLTPSSRAVREAFKDYHCCDATAHEYTGVGPEFTPIGHGSGARIWVIVEREVASVERHGLSVEPEAGSDACIMGAASNR